jgi:hypothetical protein
MGRLLNENQLHSLPGGALKVCVVGGWLRANLVIAFGLDLAKSNNTIYHRWKTNPIKYDLDGRGPKQLAIIKTRI